MKKIQTSMYGAIVLTVASFGAYAGDIDLDCAALSRQMVDRLDAEGLLSQSEAGRQRALAIILDQCNDTEASAEQQHEADKQETLDNWFFEKQPEKSGNKRLKNLKR